ncbi:MAG TPA: metallopeptidase family protein [Kiritimatiellia bacterium]|nr:metallopeptidase family protein [Kiritimatiellia bacterium]HMO99026.1 metallopeptidase family protein [Kiritimatiellia bacterium]HMP96102.1 metallopeptidase family protein [Kiritimatiellia bacterium]
MRAPGGKEHLRRRLYVAAHQEVKAVIAALPVTLKNHARAVPVIFEMTPRPGDLKDGIAPDTLGLFTGASLADGHDTYSVGPTEIILYMENLWEFARHDASEFREEVRRTYLHELGHYLGLDEDDLLARDLD